MREGIYIIEALNLEELARDGVREFAFACLPLKLRGDTGSPSARSRWCSIATWHALTRSRPVRALPLGRRHEPVLTVEDGDTVILNTRDITDEQIGPDSTARTSTASTGTASTRSPARIRVVGEKAGDAHVIDILGLETQDWGWTAIIPGLGLLADDFAEPYLRIFDIAGSDVAQLEGATVPLAPFLGTMGVCPRARATRS